MNIEEATRADDWREFLDVPVAVQLAAPLAVVDNDGEPRNRVEHKGHTYGFPQMVKVGREDQMDARLMMIGVLRLSASPRLLILRTKGHRGAVVDVAIRPEQIVHASVVVEPGEGLPLIQTPAP